MKDRIADSIYSAPALGEEAILDLVENTHALVKTVRKSDHFPSKQN